MYGVSFTAFSLRKDMILKCPACKRVVARGVCIILVQNELGFHILGTQEPIVCPHDGREEKGFPLLFDSTDDAWKYAHMIDDDDSFGAYELIPCTSIENILLH